MKKVLVRGPALSQSGYGEHTRLVLRSLRSREEELDLYLLSTSWGATNWIFEDDEERAWLDSLIQKTAMLMQQKQMPQPDVSIQVTIPLEWERMAPINIGVTAGIETTKIAGEWIEKANLMDKIIVPSQFARYAFDETSYDAQNQQTGEIVKGYKNETPIEVIPYPRKDWDFKDSPESIENQISFETDFNFLSVAQWGPRKNLESLVKWFIEENFDRENVGLVLKTNLAKNCEIDRVHCVERIKVLLDHEDYKEKKCKVYLLHGYMTEEEMALLYRHKDIHAFITTTHGEGYGLPLFEAAQAGLPIIAPAWSGHTDFLTMPVKGKNKFIPLKVDYELRHVQKEVVWDKVIIPDSMWCFPKEGSFKMKMRSMMENHGAMQKKANQLAEWLEKEWPAEEEVFDHFMSHFSLTDEVTQELEKIDISALPKISLITSVFNAADHIEQLMEDVTRQTIFNTNCEWVIINVNPEGDKEHEIIQAFVERYPDNIIYQRLDEDPGVYGVWNKAIELSSGDFITNMNCDDRRAPNALEIQAKMLLLNSDASLVYNDSYVVQEANVMWEDIKDKTQRYNFEQFSKEAMLRGNLPHNNPMWRSSLHEKHGNFNDSYRSAGDWEFWLRCTFEGEKFVKTPSILGVYYFNPQGISTNPDNDSWKQEEEFKIFRKYQAKLLEEM
jgi:hypothetical protein